VLLPPIIWLLIPHWTAYLTALLTPVIAVLATYIAYQQWRLNRHKLKLDLFERRWNVYATANDLMVALINGSEEERRNRFSDFGRRLMDARFICSAKTVLYLESIAVRRSKLLDAERNLRQVNPGEPGRAAVEKSILVDEVAGLREDLDRLVTVFESELQVAF
jgi:hypothetical protein